ncbi:MAG: hypothetical protein O6700_07750 [Gammaproteobacteria bacterium]|nr:hypothetical protein [Gammaproteobacteria bacterium]
MRRFGILLLGAVLLAGCSTSEVRIAHTVALVPATETIPEAQLLDVAVVIFDPGVPDGEIDKEVLEDLLRNGTFVHIRRTEARFMTVHLRDTLQKSGHWGAVWVTPEESLVADLQVTAEILHSDGDRVQLDVQAVDASGRVWLDQDYEMSTAAGAYNRQRYPDRDPYQDVFNSIANDLAEIHGDLSAREAENLRAIAQLRFAGDLSPEVYVDYLEPDRRGVYSLNRLPAEDDPQFERTLRVREREHLFVETLNEHYEDFYQSAEESYNGWREFAREEAISIRELQRSSRWRTTLGIATIVASVLYGANSDGDFTSRILRDAMMYTGMDLIKTAAVRRDEKRLHSETLEELSASFDDEVKPMVVQIEGTQHRLTGTANAQYEEWKELLLALYTSETGFVPAIDIYTEPLPVAEREIEVEAEAEVQELEVFTIEPEDLEADDDAATQTDPETIAGAVSEG